jgi:hypothetical protein
MCNANLKEAEKDFITYMRMSLSYMRIYLFSLVLLGLSPYSSE